MEKVHFSIHIDAPVETVWSKMLDAEPYKVWTSVFNPGSRFEGSWEEGSKILFIGPNPDGTPGEGGMVSRIKENRKHEYLSIEHIGIYMNGVEDTTSEEAKKWTPAYENYTFASSDGGTDLSIDMDVTEELKNEMEELWPKALQTLKEISEA